MLRVSGPHKVSVYNVHNTKVALLGDIHFSKQGSCNKCDTKKSCNTVVQLLDNLQEPFDIFLEALYTDEHGKKSAKQRVDKDTEDWLSDTIKHFKDELYEKHNTSQRKRVHYADIRSHDSFSFLELIPQVFTQEKEDNFLLMLALSIIRDFKTNYSIKRFIDACIKYDDHKGKVAELLGDKAKLYINKENLTSYKGIHNIHRIRKQILKLSPKLQRKLMTYHNDKCKIITTDMLVSKYDTLCKLVLKTPSLVSRYSHMFDMIILKWMSHVMDIYLIARLLYYIEKGDSKTIAVYVGSAHTTSVEHFLSNYLQNDAQQVWKYDSAQKKTKDKRCVYIPKEIIQSMVK
jgi:hypothetical protein